MGLLMVPAIFPTDKNKKRYKKGVSFAISRVGMGVIGIFDYLLISACDYGKKQKDFKRNKLINTSPYITLNTLPNCLT